MAREELQPQRKRAQRYPRRSTRDGEAVVRQQDAGNHAAALI